MRRTQSAGDMRDMGSMGSLRDMGSMGSLRDMGSMGRMREPAGYGRGMGGMRGMGAERGGLKMMGRMGRRRGLDPGMLVGCFVAAFVLSAVILIVAKPKFVYDAVPKTAGVVVKHPWHWHRLWMAAIVCAVIVTVLCWAMAR